MSSGGGVRRLPEIASRQRWKIVGAVIALTGAAAAGLPRLELQAGLYELFPDVPGPVRELARYGETFRAGDELVLLVQGDSPRQVEQATRWLAHALEAQQIIRRVRAGVEAHDLVASVGRSILLLPGEETWPKVRRRLTEQVDARVERLRRVLLSPVTPPLEVLRHDPLGLMELLLHRAGRGADRRTGLYASPDRRAALLFAQPAIASSNSEAVARLMTEVGALREQLRGRPEGAGIEVSVTGSYAYAYHMARLLRRDLTVSGLAALVGALAVLLWAFRSLRLIPLAALVSILAVLWTLAVAAVTVGQLNALSLAFAALCIGMGLDALIHITVRARRTAGDSGHARVLGAMRALAPALLAASLTTVAAFLTFATSAFAGLTQIGLLAACGLALTFSLTLLLTPVLTRLVPAQPAAGGQGVVQRALARLARLPTRARWPVVALAILLAGGAAVAARGLTFSSDLTRLAPADIPPVRAERAIAQAFERGQHRLIVTIRGQDVQPVLEVNDAVTRELRELQARGHVVELHSVAEILPSRATQERRRQERSVDAEGTVSRVRTALEERGLDADAFQPFYDALARPAPLTPESLPESLWPLVGRQLHIGAGGAMVAITLYMERGARAATVVERLSGAGRAGVAVEVTGTELAGAQMARLLRQDLVRISLLSLAAVLLMLVLLIRRPWPVVAAILSLSCTGLLFGALLRLLGIELDLYNLMVLPVLIGYGVDDHIYVVRHAVDHGVSAAVSQSGPAVVVTTLTSMAAFGGLLICQLPGLRALGLTALIGLALALLGSLVVMPALLGRR